MFLLLNEDFHPPLNFLVPKLFASVFIAFFIGIIFLLLNKKLLWKAHLMDGVLIIETFLPWVTELFTHMWAAKKEFWIPDPNFMTQYFTYPLSCMFGLLSSSYILLS